MKISLHVSLFIFLFILYTRKYNLRVKTLVNLTMWKMERRTALHKMCATSPSSVNMQSVLSYLYCQTYLSNSSWHYGPYGSLWTGMSPTKYYMDRSPQNIIWTEAKLKSIYYFMGDRPVHKLPFGSKCHELFVILYSIHANLSDDMFLLLYI